MTAPPQWLSQFADSVAANVIPFDDATPVGCHYHEGEDGWEITLFVAKAETVGGPRDGQLQASRFRVDLLGLCSIFTKIHTVHWQAQRMGRGDELGPHLAVEGEYLDQQIWLRIPAAAPAQFPPWRHVTTPNSRWEEVW